MSIYDFTVNSIRGKEVNLADYKDHVVLIVNTATKCGFAPQFDGLEALYKKYQKAGLIVLGFPSNQFKQELADGHAAARTVGYRCRASFGRVRAGVQGHDPGSGVAGGVAIGREDPARLAPCSRYVRRERGGCDGPGG